jgi:methylmalonyl-CoA mutase cobalamin-binding domain/chain
MKQEHVIVATMGLDQHENGAVAITRILREAQMRVQYLGRFNTPRTIAEAAAAEPVDVVGISCHSWEYMTLVPELIRELAARGVTAPVVIGGSVITPSDAARMLELGVSAVVNGAPTDDQVIDTIRRVANREASPA